MKKVILSTVIAAVGLTRVFAGDSTFTLRAQLFVFDPGHTNICSAKWVDKEGLADSDQDLASGKPGKALVLKKLGTTATNASSGASIYGVAWTSFKELGFDLRNDGHQGAGAPRFNVATADGGFYFCGAAAAGSQTTFMDAQHRGWTRIRFNGAPNECFPTAIPPNSIILSIDLVFDEGTDTGPDHTGTATLDNITVNGTQIQKE